MANHTPNYNLSTPEATDTQASFIADYVTNMGIIDSNLGGGGGGGSTVAWSQTQASGTKIATITINGTPTDVYSPTPPTDISDLNNDTGFTATAWNQIQASGTKIAEVTIDGTTTNVYAPSGGGGGSSVEANPAEPATDVLNTIKIDGVVYSLPSGGGGRSITRVTSNPSEPSIVKTTVTIQKES